MQFSSRHFVYSLLLLAQLSITSSTNSVFAADAWPLSPSKFTKDRVKVKLPSKYHDVRIGGGGRLFLFQLTDQKKIAVFDVVEARVINTIEISSDKSIYAANLSTLVVGDESKLVSFDLKTGRQVATADLTDGFKVTAFGLGYAGTGPLLVISHSGRAGRDSRFEFYDPTTLKPLPINMPVRPELADNSRINVFVSPSENVFTLTNVGRSPATLVRWILRGNNLTRHTFRAIGGGTPLRGDRFFFGSRGIYSIDGKPIREWHHTVNKQGIAQPAMHGPMFYRLQPMPHPQSGQFDDRPVNFYTLSSEEPFGQIMTSGLGNFKDAENEFRRQFGRSYLIPDAHSFVVLPYVNDTVVLHRFNLDQLLSSSKQDYLFVDSVPPPQVNVGNSFRYRINARAKKKPLKFKLKKGPRSMTVSADGVVQWNATKRPLGGDINAEVSVTDSAGKEIVHHVRTKVLEGGKLTPGRFVRVDDRHVELPGTEFLCCRDYGEGGYIAVSAGSALVIARDGITVKKQVTLPKDYRLVGGRKDYFVCMTLKPAAIELVDRKSLKVLKKISLPSGMGSSIVLHPRKPITYAGVRVSYTKIPGSRFAVVDETKGKARQEDDYIGGTLVIDAGGRRLLSAYSDNYRRGTQLLFNPGRIQALPRFGYLNWLISYKLDSHGVPRFENVNDKPGALYHGVRLSGSGKYAVSIPHQSIVRLWNPSDLDEVPTNLSTETVEAKNDFSIHPVLKIGASLTGKPPRGVRIFNLETGTRDNREVDIPKDSLDDAEIRRIRFSPDGKHLILHAVKEGSVGFLVRSDLKLSASESKIVATIKSGGLGPITDGSSQHKTPIPLRELHALRSGRGGKFTVEEISRHFMDAVVVVKSDEGSGTGFVVGSSGYVVTCAHCLPGAGLVNVVYRVRSDGRTREESRVAKVLRIDEDRDLALLKIDPSVRLRSIRLTPRLEASTGARVCVIGHPGLGEEVLGYTVTEGIISSASRRIEGATYVQTSATINPGCSGGPMFDHSGLVVGLVVRKAKIEGTGFAVPAADVVQFLAKSATTQGAAGQLRRDWVNAKGNRSIDGVYLGHSGQNLKLLLPSKKTLEVEFKYLSANDREFLKLLKESK